MCARHAERFSAPRGWDVVRIQQEFAEPPPSADDIDALAHAVREAGKSREPDPETTGLPVAEKEPPRRGHLRVV